MSGHEVVTHFTECVGHCDEVGDRFAVKVGDFVILAKLTLEELADKIRTGLV